eukprot:1580677-Karenia_brevis.AAC.1
MAAESDQLPRSNVSIEVVKVSACDADGQATLSCIAAERDQLQGSNVGIEIYQGSACEAPEQAV